MNYTFLFWYQPNYNYLNLVSRLLRYINSSFILIEPTYLNETDSHGISSYNSYSDDEGLTKSWTFEVPDGFEAVLTSINVNVRYTIISLGAGTDPTKSSSHLYSVLDSSSPDLVVPENKFWIKFIRVRSYGTSSTSVDITLRPLQIGNT